MNRRDKEPRVRLEVPEGSREATLGPRQQTPHQDTPRQKHPAVSPWHSEGGARLTSKGRAGIGQAGEREAGLYQRTHSLWVESRRVKLVGSPSQEGGA